MLAAVAVALGIGAASWYYAPRTAELRSGTLLQQPRPLPEFSLVDQDGTAYTRARLEGGWTVLFAGFTHCPDVCPTTLALLKDVRRRAAADVDLRVLFLSVDPQRDTPATLKAYTSHFDPSFAGVTAPEPQLGQFARALGLAYAKVPGASDDTYQMDHSAALVLIDPQARIAGYFSPPFDAEVLARDLAAAIQRRA